MNDPKAEKNLIIQQMMAMQKKFIEREHSNGVEAEEYFSPEEGHVLEGYQQQYDELANKLIDLAHQEKGSNR